jgi:hypothetical protein
MDRAELEPQGHRHRRSNSRAISLGHKTGESGASAPQSVRIPDLESTGSCLSGSNLRAYMTDNGKQMRTLAVPSEIITTPATPLAEAPSFFDDYSVAEVEDDTANRLSAFSFGAKPSMSTSPSAPTLGTSRRQSLQTLQPLVPNPTSPTLSPYSNSVPNLNRLSTPLSRPPSLLLTRATPLSSAPPPAGTRHSFSAAPSSPSPAGPSVPSSPGRRRHSHNRSTSISIPNANRPVSLGVHPIPVSPSYSISPSSPTGDRSRLSGPMNGTRLKFEPSGRGAEAEKEKEESRRRALDKLTGGTRPSPTMDQQQREDAHRSQGEISLPDFDDDDSDSVASSIRPLSGAFGFGSFSFQSSGSSGSRLSGPTPSLATSPFGWEDEADGEMPSWGGFGAATGGISDVEKELGKHGLGFGMDIEAGMGSVGLAVGGSSTVGSGMSSASVNGGLSVLAEEEEEDMPVEEPVPTASAEPDPIGTEPTGGTISPAIHAPAPLAPTSSRLRELHLLSSASISSSAASSNTNSFSPNRNSDPVLVASPKDQPLAYNGIGRGFPQPRSRPRPRPLSGLGYPSLASSSVASVTSHGVVNVFAATASSSSTPSTTVVTPKSATKRTRPRAPSTGSRGSSISYKKDDSIQGSRGSRGSIGSGLGSLGSGSTTASLASRDWNAGSGSVTAASLGGLGSPPFAGWARNGGLHRPCPRPKSLVGLGGGSVGAGRILKEVGEEGEEGDERMEEMDDNDLESRGGWQSAPLGAGYGSSGFSGGFAERAEGDVPHEEDVEMGSKSIEDLEAELREVEMERDGLREDVSDWRKRCRGLEERLEEERKEAGVLRERARKCRLSASICCAVFDDEGFKLTYNSGRPADRCRFHPTRRGRDG